eukprot:11738285-Heterocapsa_arctica.AAC.1
MANEMQSMKDFKVLREVPDTEPGEAGKKPINTGWVLSDRGPTKVKCRIVAQDINWGDWVDAFAATPTSAGQRLLLREAIKGKMEVVIGDVST